MKILVVLIKKCIPAFLQLRYSKNSRPEVFCKKGVLRSFSKFTGKHLCQSLFLIKLQTPGLQLY